MLHTIPNSTDLCPSLSVLPAVANHGVEEALVEQVFEENKKFFLLPEQEKRRILADANNRC
jgi:isopenicillin N synthase-like dioxygenase